jgi:hypothetical protein
VTSAHCCQREHQAALEGRIHQLEAQLASHINTPMHGMESIDETVMSATASHFDWGQSPPDLTLDTSFSTPFSPGSEMDLASFSAGAVPRISINECELYPAEASPVPSLGSGTTRGSSPEMPVTSAPSYLPPHMAYTPTSKPFPPNSGLPHTAPSWEFMAGGNIGQLKPSSVQSGNPSRRTSLSSHSLESDETSNEEETDVMPLAPAPRLPRQGIFAAHTESPPPGSSRSSYTDRSRAITTSTPFPSRFEAETLTSEFVQHLETFDHKVYTISPSLFGRFCESVYPDPKAKNAPVETSVSTQMARFHVFMAMAIGMKFRIKDCPENTNALLDTCYDLAMQQASSPPFWQENGGIEATQLLSIFASIRKEPGFVPKPMQPSFSW